MIAIYGVCIPLGIAKAVRHKSLFDNISSILVFIGYAIPGWVAGILMILLFASHWELFPLGELVSDNFEDLSLWRQLADLAWHTVLPLAAIPCGGFQRSHFFDEEHADGQPGGRLCAHGHGQGAYLQTRRLRTCPSQQSDPDRHHFRKQYQHHPFRVFSDAKKCSI